jgi:hypothetical protein
VRLASPIGSAAGGSVNLSTSLSNVAKLAAHSKFVWVFNDNCDGTCICIEYSLRESVSAQGREGRGFDSDPRRNLKKKLYSMS